MKKPKTIDSMPISFDLNLCLTNCSYKCRHCYAESGLVAKRPLSLEKVKALVKDKFLPLKQKGHDFSISMDTQELLYPEYLDWLRYRKKIGMPVTSLAGDGFPFSPKMIDKVDAAWRLGLRSYVFSIFGGEEFHDWFTGRKGSYRGILNFACEWKNKLNISWRIFLHKKNIGQMKEMETVFRPLCKDKNNILCMVWRDQGRALDIKNLKLKLPDLEKAGLSIDDPRFYMIFTEEKAARSPKYIEFYYKVLVKQIKLNIDWRQNVYEERSCKSGLIDNINEIDWFALTDDLAKRRQRLLETAPKPEELAQYANLKDTTVYNIYDVVERWSDKYQREK